MGVEEPSPKMLTGLTETRDKEGVGIKPLAKLKRLGGDGEGEGVGGVAAERGEGVVEGVEGAG